MNKIENYLALDYGKSKIGLAIADSQIRIAFAYSTIDNDKFFWDVLGEIIRLEEIQKIIVGKLCLSGNCQKSFEEKTVGKAIEKKFKVPIAYQEEMFSTKIAQNNLKERGAKNLKKLDNQEAARIILQSWLDRT